MSKTSSRLRIGRIRLRYSLPRHYPAPDRVRADLDALVTRRLAGECGRLCSSLCPEHDGSLWFIRRVAITVRLRAGQDLEAHVRRWASEIARALGRTLTAGQGEEVVCFRQYEDYVAQFLVDLSQQRAWSKWYYRDFEGLMSLPASAAIVEALLRRPHTAESALLRLHSAGQLEAILEQLSDRQLERVLAACQPEALSTRDVHADYLRAVVEAWPAIRPWLSGSVALSARQALRLWLAVRSRHPELASGEALHSAIQVILELQDLLPAIAEPGRFEYYVSCGDLTSASLLVPDASRSCVLAFDRDPELLHQLLESIQRNEAVGASDGSREFTFVTSFGAAFLLLRVWVALGLENLVQADGCAVPERWNPAATFRFVTLLMCIGHARLEEAIADRGLRLAAGFEQDCALADLRRWCGLAGNPSDLLRQYLVALHVAGHIKGGLLRMGVVERENHSVFVIEDLETGFWVYAGAVPHDETCSAPLFAQALTQIEQATGERVRYLVLGESSDAACLRDLDQIAGATLLWEQPPCPGDCHEIRWQGTNGESVLWSRELVELPLEFTSVWTRAARRARFQADLDYYDLGDETTLSAHPMNLTWSLIASGVMKSFARRLMGFDSSSAEYLYANFLAGTSVVTVQPERIEVHLPRVPLDVVLRLTGLDGQSFPQPSKPDRMIELQLPRTSP